MKKTVPNIDTPSKNKHGQGGGSLRFRNGKADVRLSLGEPIGRKSFQLPTCKTKPQAEARRALLVELADRLIVANRVEMGLPLLERAATREGAALEDVRRAVDAIVKGEAVKRPTGEITIAELAEQWTSGELARTYPGRVRSKEDNSVRDDKQRFRDYILPLLGEIPVRRLTLDHAEDMMRRLPASLGGHGRRAVAQTLHHVMSLAVMPLRVATVNPLPKGFIPPIPPPKAKGYLYPDEDAQLLGCREIPLSDRILYGFLMREGMRSDEARRTEKSDFDLLRGAVALDKNKTNDPRMWALRPDTVRAITAWLKIRETDESCVFIIGNHPAERLRKHLRVAGIDREILFERNDTRRHVVFHDLRATFVTLGLANGRTESWVTDRTGHRSSQMISTYRRAARTVEELGLGDFGEMDKLIPEIAEAIAAEQTPPTKRPESIETAPESIETAPESKDERSAEAPPSKTDTGSRRSVNTDRAARGMLRVRTSKRPSSRAPRASSAAWSGLGPSMTERSRNAPSDQKVAGNPYPHDPSIPAHRTSNDGRSRRSQPRPKRGHSGGTGGTCHWPPRAAKPSSNHLKNLPYPFRSEPGLEWPPQSSLRYRAPCAEGGRGARALPYNARNEPALEPGGQRATTICRSFGHLQSRPVDYPGPPCLWRKVLCV